MSDWYFEDFQPGTRIESKGYTLTESDIIDFALRYDPQPFHIDAEAAAESPFGGLISSGFQTLAISFRIFYQTGVLSECSRGSPGIDELRWLLPVRPGDTLHVIAEVEEARASKSNPARGIVRIAYETQNQRNEAVMTFTSIHILALRSGDK